MSYPSKISRAFLFTFTLFTLPALADFQGRVVSVADGDTLTVLVDRTPIKVRLAQIDSPESGQAYGQKAKQSLSDLAYGKIVRVEYVVDTDRYGRTVGTVWVGNLDVNREQVRRGMAWVFKKYVTDGSLYDVEYAARKARRGLWAGAETPMAPWEFRKQRR